MAGGCPRCGLRRLRSRVAARRPLGSASCPHLDPPPRPAGAQRVVASAANSTVSCPATRESPFHARSLRATPTGGEARYLGVARERGAARGGEELVPGAELHARTAEGSPAARSTASIASQPAYTRLDAAGREPSRRARRAGLPTARQSPARVLEQQLDRLGGVLLVRADHAGRAALDPAGAVNARRAAARRRRAPARRRSASVPRPRRTARPEAAPRDSRRCGRRGRTDRLAVVGRDRPDAARVVGDELVAHDLDASTRSSPRIATGETRKRSRTERGLPVAAAANSRRTSTFRRAFVSVASAASLTGSSSSSAGSTRMSAPPGRRSPSARAVVNAACAGPRRPSTTISRNASRRSPRSPDRSCRSARAPRA